MCKLQCIATWGRPTSCQSFYALITRAIPSLESIPQSIRSWLITFYCWYFTLRCDFHLCLFDLERELWGEKTTYQIWAKSNIPRQNYRDSKVKNLRGGREGAVCHLGFDRKVIFKIPQHSETCNAPWCQISTRLGDARLSCWWFSE